MERLTFEQLVITTSALNSLGFKEVTKEHLERADKYGLRISLATIYGTNSLHVSEVFYIVDLAMKTNYDVSDKDLTINLIDRISENKDVMGCIGYVETFRQVPASVRKITNTALNTVIYTSDEDKVNRAIANKIWMKAPLKIEKVPVVEYLKATFNK